jgi:ssRNA-specific RNase YbeY (16S rRNA maturation enzyme)
MPYSDITPPLSQGALLSQEPSVDESADVLELCQAWFAVEEPPPWLLQVYRHPTVIENIAFSAFWLALEQQLPLFLKVFDAQQRAVQLHRIHGLATSLPPEQSWEVECMFVDDATMAALNQAYRGKPQTTDVLSFPTFGHSALLHHEEEDLPAFIRQQLAQQGGSLGTVVISLGYAVTHAFTPETIEPPPTNGVYSEAHQQVLLAYVLERLCHGLLHLHGQHHDTMESYQAVVAFQKQVLASVVAVS